MIADIPIGGWFGLLIVVVLVLAALWFLKGLLR